MSALKLSNEGLKNRADWEAKGFHLPAFDREAMIAATKANPFWVHFGAGNIFRAFHAADVQKELEAGTLDRGIIVAEGFDYEIVSKQYRPHDDLSVLVTLKGDGSIEKTVVGSIAESCILDSQDEAEYSRLLEIFRAPSLQMATFTITEKGYSLTGRDGSLLPDVAKDLEEGPARPASYIGKVASLLYARYAAGRLPIAMVSTDNCSHNGDKLKAAMNAFAEGWTKNGKADADFLAYVNDPACVSFPWSMIDKITPRPDASVQEILKQDGLADLEPVITSKKTYVAPFVNAEETEYLVIEDAFPNGRPDFKVAGFYFTERETVDRVEKMKVCTCLNPLHTSLAVFGCLLGYDKISEEMKDADLLALVQKVGYKEGLPVVVNPGILDPKEFIDTVLQVRVPNPFMPDTPQRIATDTSQKLAIRFGETIKAYQADPALDSASLRGIALVEAGWLRYLTAIGDDGKEFELSPDPMLESLAPTAAALKALFGKADRASVEAAAAPVLAETRIFGADLAAAGLVPQILDDLTAMLAGPGAVRKVLHEAVQA